MDAGNLDLITGIPLEAIVERLQRYRLHVPRAEQAMARSFERFGQISPIVVCRQEGIACYVAPSHDGYAA